jgi:two-component system, LytTR family, sensor kinase
MISKIRNATTKYWWFQIAGWGIFLATNFFFAYIFDRYNLLVVKRLLIFVFLGILFTHLMRKANKKANLLNKKPEHQILLGILVTFLFSFTVALIYSLLIVKLDLLSLREQEEKATFQQLLLNNSFSSFIFFLIWNLIYFIYHYINSSRETQLNNLRLEALVKELELKTIKAHINPHFIFNSLNSIRALVDEDPDRARRAITELSNILRSSMQTEKLETVPLERELSIVKDYLALEQMRFEERLKVEFDIDEDTLDQPVPPMMLQTLVENAIKHGISRQLNGGLVRIKSDYVGDHHELVIQNTGKLNGRINAEGFGLQSTENRLKLMFGDKARFEIKDVDSNMVEARVTLPVELY